MNEQSAFHSHQETTTRVGHLDVRALQLQFNTTYLYLIDHIVSHAQMSQL